MALDHVTVPTCRFQATVDFLGKILEFPAIEHPAGIPMRANWFDVGDGQAIHVLEVESVAEPPNEGEFNRHIALTFPHARWLRIRNQLEQENIEIVPPQRDSNISRFFTLDPNGYCYEIVMR